MSRERHPAVWFPTVRTGTGTDVFTERLAAGLQARGIRAAITWLPLRAEYAPWTVPVPEPPSWATVVHISTWLHPRFLPRHLPVVATIHHAVHDPALRPYKGFARAAYHRGWIAPRERRVLRRATRIIAVSRHVAGIARAALLDVPMQVIPNGVDTERFRPPAARPPHRPFRLLYVGSWRTLKGVGLLAPIMCELGGAFELRYTGGAAAGRDKQDMPPNMHDLGRLAEDRVIVAMQEADTLLFPSRSEGLPLAVIEAMACGVPVIATRGSALVEVVGADRAGLLCPQDDVAAFVAAARSLAADPEHWRSLSLAARARALAHFSVDAMLDAYVGVYRHV